MATIGSIQTTGQQVQPAAPRINPQNFGAGISRALGQMANTVAAYQDSEENIALAYVNRQRKVEKAQTEISWIKEQAARQQDLLVLQREASASPSGVTNSYEQAVKKRNEEFLQKVPAWLKDEYSTRLQEFSSNAINNVFQFEIRAEDENFLKDFRDIRQEALNDILSGNGTLEDWDDILGRVYETSPLATAATEDLIKETRAMLEKAELNTALLSEAEAPEMSRGARNVPADGSDVVAAGLPGPVRLLLNTIAGVESPGYDVMYGGERFTSYDQHPNKKVPIASGPNVGNVSTAAGRYQFINSTWQRVAQELGFKDFSPENQDRGAWWLAREEYKRKTGGDLLLALQSKDPTVLKAVKKVIGGQWEGIAKMSDAEFVSAMQAQVEGTESDLLNDPRYDNVPYDQKLILQQEANNKAQAEIARQQKAQQELQQQILNETIFRIQAGGENAPSFSDIQQITADYGLSVNQNNAMVKAYEAANARQINIAGAESKLSNPYYVFDQRADADQVNAWAEDRLIPSILNKDQNAVETSILPSVQRLGYMPAGVSTALQQMAQSTNRQDASFAYGVLSRISQTIPNSFVTSVSSEVEGQVEFFQRMQGLIPEDELWAEINARKDPAYMNTVATYEKAAETMMRDVKKGKPDSFTPRSIAREMGLIGRFESATLSSPQQEIALKTEFESLYTAEFVRYKDHDKAYAAAAKMLGRRWGTTETGGSYIMKLPPERSPALPQFDGGHEYLDRQIRKDLNLAENQGYRLVSDGHTEVDFQSGTPPRYRVVVEQMAEDGTSTGVWLPLVDDPQKPQYPLLYQFEFSEELKAAQVGLAVDMNEEQRLESEIYELQQAFALGEGRQTEEVKAALSEAMTELSALRGKRTEKQKKKQELRNSLIGATAEEARQIRDQLEALEFGE